MALADDARDLDAGPADIDDAAERAAIDAVPERYRVNLDELAAVVDKSTNTLRAYMRQFPDDFPMLSRGTHGRAYLFDSRAVVGFFRDLDRREAEANERRREEVKGLRLELLGGETAGADAEALRLSPRDRRELLYAEELANRIARHRKEHCRAADVEETAAAWAAAIQQEMQVLIEDIATDLDLGREARLDLERRLGVALDRAAAAGRAAVSGGGDAGA
ncbi:hypothetical protein [Thalassobaculum sp.]|uniref:hypothetical protein n=1 Tax=Thalassobaculum sp. TaxID=2022740 RepID=UPI0032EE8519